MGENEENKQETPEVKEVDQVQEAKQVVEQLKEQNALLAKQLDRQEKLNLQAVLSGQSTAGDVQKSDEEKAVESAKKLVAGTGFEEFID